ncbi:MAG: hypothetical protein E7812_18715 [Phenylobacterium sp.]|nr:MAG: hypothetical protein E7812_18715 [Phenylobacterium sp.]
MADGALSLYFQLKPGEKADLEVVASAALAWVEGLRASARAMDPDAVVQVEIVDADESSLLINAILKWFEKTVEPKLDRLARGAEKLPRTKQLAITLAAFLVITGPETYDFYFGKDKFTAEDRKHLEELLAQTRDNKDVQAARRRFYRAVERDPSIVAVGVKEAPDGEPVAIVPGRLFAEGGGLWEQDEDTIQERITRPEIEVVLIKPALVHDPRAWTFKPDGLPEFDAVMRDPEVLQAMRTGLPQSMREGITMRVRLEVKEVMVDGQWKLVRGGRSVTKVISPPLGP